MGDLRNAVEEFKKNIKNEKLKELKSIQDKGTIEVAVELAYDDAKRTMTGIGAHKDERKEAQGEIFLLYTSWIFSYFYFIQFFKRRFQCVQLFLSFFYLSGEMNKKII